MQELDHMIRIYSRKLTSSYVSYELPSLSSSLSRSPKGPLRRSVNPGDLWFPQRSAGILLEQCSWIRIYVFLKFKNWLFTIFALLHTFSRTMSWTLRRRPGGLLQLAIGCCHRYSPSGAGHHVLALLCPGVQHDRIQIWRNDVGYHRLLTNQISIEHFNIKDTVPHSVGVYTSIYHCVCSCRRSKGSTFLLRRAGQTSIEIEILRVYYVCNQTNECKTIEQIHTPGWGKKLS